MPPCEGCGITCGKQIKKLCRDCSKASVGNLKVWRGRKARGVKTPPILVRRDQLAKNRQHNCKACGKTYYPKTKHRVTFCSRGCAHQWQRVEALARSPAAVVTYRRTCTICEARFSTSKKARLRCRKCRKKANPDYSPVKGSARQCRLCGSSFIAMSGDAFSSSMYCSKPCKNAWARTQPWYKEMQRAAKARRRAARRGAKVSGHFKPADIFERDGWRCKNCGVRTPKKLRGSYLSNAPELDHIVPISKGGEHSRVNVQCLCRKCNSSKSDGAGGQLLLFG